MTAPYPHPAHVQRLAHECAQLAYRTSQIAAELAALQAAAAPPPPPPVPVPPMRHTPQPPPPPQTPPIEPRRSWLSRAADDGRLVGAVLAVAGVAVTVVGVGLLLVLAAQAGLLRPEVRVAAGVVFAVVLALLAIRSRRHGGGVGAIAFAATGVATAYLDVIAVTRIYHWFPAIAGLLVAAAVGGAGVAWARRWRSEQLAVIAVVPLVAVAPLVTGGVDLRLVGFMLVLAAACVAAAHRTPWSALPVVGVGAASLWTTAAVVAARHAGADVPLLAAACALTAVAGLAAASSSVLRRAGGTDAAVASILGCVPVLISGVAVDRPLAAALLGAVAVVTAAMVGLSARRFAVPRPVRTTWAGLATISTLVAVPTAVDAALAVPALLAIAMIVSLAGRTDRVIATVGVALSVVGGVAYLGWSVPVDALLTPAERSGSQAVAAVVASALVIAAAGAVGLGAWRRTEVWVVAGVVALYGLTATVVTVGVAAGGVEAGFLGGHMVATVLWVVASAGVLAVAGRVPAGARRRLPIGAALTLAGAAVVKLVTFDLATLDGAFRVGAFVAAGIVLLAVGARQARARAA